MRDVFRNTAWLGTLLLLLLLLLPACDKKQQNDRVGDSKVHDRVGESKLRPLGFVDTVQPGAILTGVVDVKGWALSEDGIQSVCVYIDRARVNCTDRATEERPDVAKVVTMIPNAEKSGWGVTFDSTSIAPGDHEFVVQATTKTGASRNLIDTKIGITRYSIASSMDNILITAPSGPQIYLLKGGRKYNIKSPRWIANNGYGGEIVHGLKASELAAIPSGYDLAEQSAIPGTPAALDKKLVVGGDGKLYAVEGGRRHWILDGRWIEGSQYANQAPVQLTATELEALPLGGDFSYTPRGQIVLIVFLTCTLFAFIFVTITGHTERLQATRLFQFARRKLSPRTSWVVRVVLLMTFATLIALREPNLLSHPRFWAEEGTIWFQYAVSHSVIQTLLFVYPLSGYFILTPNIGAILSSRTAAMFGLEYAPTATTIFAFVIQVLAIALILFGRSRLFDSLWKAIVGCLIVLFAATNTDEIWLNTINSMSFLGLISLVLVFEETWNWSSRMKWVSRLALVFCGLSSPYTAALLPLFLITAWRDKQREQRTQCLILIFCVLVQAGVVVRTRIEAARARLTPSSSVFLTRGTQVRLDASMVNVFLWQMTNPALGSSTREHLLDELGLKQVSVSAASLPSPSPSLTTAGWLCFILITAALWVLRGRTLYSTTNLALGAFLILAIFTCVASLHGSPLHRYAFLPGLAFLILLLINSEQAKSVATRYISAVILSYGLATGIVNYWSPETQYGPPWSREVQIWKADHSYRLNDWPPGWGGIVYPGHLSR